MAMAPSLLSHASGLGTATAPGNGRIKSRVPANNLPNTGYHYLKRKRLELGPGEGHFHTGLWLAGAPPPLQSSVSTRATNPRD